jgi:hypothetical protein
MNTTRWCTFLKAYNELNSPCSVHVHTTHHNCLARSTMYQVSGLRTLTTSLQHLCLFLADLGRYVSARSAPQNAHAFINYVQGDPRSFLSLTLLSTVRPSLCLNASTDKFVRHVLTLRSVLDNFIRTITMIRYLVALATMAMFCHAATLRAQRVTRLDESPSHMDIIHRKLTRTSIDQRSVALFKEVVKPSGGNPVLATVSLSAVSNAASAQDRVLTTGQGQVTTLQLINAGTDEVIINLKDKMVVALDAVPNMTSPSFNINALVSGNDVRSVQ